MIASIKFVIGMILCAALLTSCGDSKVINKIMLVQTLGFDIEDDEIKGSALIGDYRKKNEPNTLLMYADTDSEFSVLPALNTKMKNEIEYGQLGTIVFGKSYASRGIDAFMEDLCRETRISNLLQLAVTDLEAKELLKAAQRLNESFLINEMIEQNINNGNLPNINLHRALYSYYSNRQSLFLPHLTLRDGELEVDGLGLFRSGKLVSRLNLNQSLYLKLLMENGKNGSLSVPNPNKARSSKLQLVITASKVTYKVTGEPSSPNIVYSVSINTKVTGFPDLTTIQDRAYKEQLEHHISSYCEQEINRMLAALKKDKLDPLGLANKIAHRPSAPSSLKDTEGGTPIHASAKVRVHIVQTPVDSE